LLHTGGQKRIFTGMGGWQRKHLVQTLVALFTFGRMSSRHTLHQASAPLHLQRHCAPGSKVLDPACVLILPRIPGLMVTAGESLPLFFAEKHVTCLKTVGAIRTENRLGLQMQNTKRKNTRGSVRQSRPVRCSVSTRSL